MLTTCYESKDEYTAKVSIVSNAESLSQGPVEGTKWMNKTGQDVADKLPGPYKQFTELFSRDAAERLPAWTDNDLRIELEDGKKPPVGRLFPLS